MQSLANLTWSTMPTRPLALVPTGSFEQHGPHLPFDTDVVIAEEVAKVAALLIGPDAVVLPPLVYGSSGEHQSFPGTVSIGRQALVHVLIEFVRSAAHWTDRVIFVNAHGGNITALAEAVNQLRYEGHDCAWVACATEDVDAHAGYTETSIMLHLEPHRVRLDLAEIGNTASIRDLLPEIIAGGVSAVTANGVLGDPAGATAAEGARCLTEMARDVSEFVKGNLVNTHGQLIPTASGVHS